MMAIESNHDKKPEEGSSMKMGKTIDQRDKVVVLVASFSLLAFLYDFHGFTIMNLCVYNQGAYFLTMIHN